MKKLIIILKPIVNAVLLSYWYIFRPKMCGVKVILSCGDGILLIKNTYNYGWSFPGGLLGKSETKDFAIIREVQEELGITIDSPILLGSFISTSQYKQDTIFVYKKEIKTKEVNIKNLEIEKAEWFSRDNLPKLGPTNKKVFEMYK